MKICNKLASGAFLVFSLILIFAVEDFLVLASTPLISASPASVSPGAAITVDVSNGPANPTDWVGLYVPGTANTAFIDWFYLNGQKSVPLTGLTSANLKFTAPLTTGTYHFRFFANDGYTLLAESGNVTVTGTAAGLLHVSSVNPRYFADTSGKIVFLAAHSGCPFLITDAWGIPPACFSKETRIFAVPGRGTTVVGKIFLAAASTNLLAPFPSSAPVPAKLWTASPSSISTNLTKHIMTS
jgi:hypothetical protein